MITRRNFVRTASLSAWFLSMLSFPEKLFANAKPKLAVNGQRIENRIHELAKFGRREDGHGYRVGYSAGDIEGRGWFMQVMKDAGLNPFIDAGGNIIGKRKGKNASLKPIGFGSHIDMVPDGGNYDGTVGSLAALEVIEILNENKITTEHPLEVIIFANEEGGLDGSRSMVGNMTAEGLKVVTQSGKVTADGIRDIGGNPDAIKSSVRPKGDLYAWVELHIEQGGILEAENINIGVVEGIVGIVDWEIVVEGFANHAGTTSMKLRRDALLAASKLIVAVNEVINSVPGNQVGTVGKIAAKPGAFNVVPGLVNLGLEIRDLSQEKIESLFSEIEKRAAIIANENKVKITFDRKASAVKPALTDKRVQQKINETAGALGLTTRFMQSGAGHDSQQMANICPVGMIFVPSVGGISHSPNEFTKPIDMTNGANVLLQTILELDKVKSL